MRGCALTCEVNCFVRKGPYSNELRNDLFVLNRGAEVDPCYTCMHANPSALLKYDIYIYIYVHVSCSFNSRQGSRGVLEGLLRGC